MLFNEDRLWAGSEASLYAVMQAEGGVKANMAAGVSAVSGEQALPRLLTIEDGMATISIKGPLVNSDSPWLEVFGLTGYPEIREALLAAAVDSSVYQILLDVESGGGSVSGCPDTASMIRAINDKVKPVTTYADFMASAAYWLGCSAGQVYAGKASMVGSIGVIATFKEYTEANKMEGVTVTVIRAGKEKALANSNEKLTPKAEAQLQAMVNASYGVFVEHVSEMRGVSYLVADKKMADGQEFIGKDAVDVGLIDGVMSFDAVVTDLKGKILAYKEKLMHNRGNGGKPANGRSSATLFGEVDMNRKALSEQDIAAVLAGGLTLDIEGQAGGLSLDIEGQAGSVSDEPVGDAKVEQSAAEATTEQPEVAASQSAIVAELATLTTTVQLLNSQAATKDEALLQSNIKVARLEEQVAEMSAAHAGLLDIAAKSISNMNVAMNGAMFKADGLQATAVLAEHARVSEQFQSKFKAGGVAAVSSSNTSVKQPQVSPRHLARVNAARFQPK